MIWQDVIVRRPLGDHEVAEGLAAGFGIKPNEVLVHRGADDFPEPGGAKVVCVVTERAEGFRNVVSLYTYFDPPCDVDPVAVIKEFVRVVGTECLITDDSPDPYTMIHIVPDGDMTHVKLDVDRLDDKGEYHIRE